MKALTHRSLASMMFAIAFVLTALFAAGCSTSPSVEDKQKLLSESETARMWFESRTTGLREQINNAAAYIVYPNVGQVGVLLVGGKSGKGVVRRPDGTQIGWADINTANIGPQIGAQGFKMLVVFEDEQTLDMFKKNQLRGDANAVAIAGDAGGSAAAIFENGVAVYQGANTGLLASANIGLNLMRFVPFEEGH